LLIRRWIKPNTLWSTRKANDEVELLRGALEELRQAVQARMPGAIPATVEDMTDEVIEAVVMDGPKMPTRIER
jgi:HAMP domain-containing protein